MQKLTQALAISAEVRGTDASGISYIKHGCVTIYKRPKPAHKIQFRVPAGTKAVMGHTRFTTQGSQKFNYNNHPFYGYAGKEFAFVHNGVLHNDKELREQKKLPATKIETDSYVAVQLLEQSGKLDLNPLKSMTESVEGSFTFTVLDTDNTLYFVKGTSPLYLIHFEKWGLYLYASTQSILENALKLCGISHYQYSVLAVKDGDVLRIDSSGNMEKGNFSMPYFRPFHDASIYDFAAEETEWDVIFEVCNCFGVDIDTVTDWLDYGYSAEEVEAFLMCPDGLREE